MYIYRSSWEINRRPGGSIGSLPTARFMTQSQLRAALYPFQYPSATRVFKYPYVRALLRSLRSKLGVRGSASF